MTTKSKNTSNFKNLLILATSYPNENNTYIRGIFIKKQLDYLKLYFDNVYVIAPVFNCFRNCLKDKLCNDYTYDNVKVYFPRCFYIPIFYFNKLLIDNRLNVVENLIEKENLSFDLIHSHFTWPSGYIGVKLKERYDVPVIITIHENREWFNKEIIMNNPLLNYSWRMADALIRVNTKDVPSLKSFNKNAFFIPNSFSKEFKLLDSDFCKEELNLPQGKKIIFSLGALIERKGINYLIDSMKVIVNNRNDCLCYIGGSGKLKDKLQRQINDLNLKKYVKLVGFIPDAKLPLWMNACDVFVLPSLSESFGVVLIEAMACGKPVVTTYNGGSEEIVNSEDYGFLVNPKNSTDLAEKIERALDKEWNQNSILSYVNQYSLEDVGSKILKCYRDVLI